MREPFAGSVSGPDEVTLDWQCYEPATAHRIDIRDGDNWRTLGAYTLPTAAAKIGGLPQDTSSYRLRITAFQGTQEGQSHEITLVRIPAAPRIETAAWQTNGGTTIRWDPVAGANKGYRVEIYDHTEPAAWVRLTQPARPSHIAVNHQGADTQAVLSRISPRYITVDEYTGRDSIRIRVAAVSAATRGPASELTVLLPKPVAPTPTDLSASMISANIAIINYTIPTTDPHQCSNYNRRGVEVMTLIDDQWVVIGGNDDGYLIVNTTGTAATVHTLDATKEEHLFKVRHYGAANCYGQLRSIISPWSDAVTASSTIAAPAGVSVTLTEAGKARVSWNQVSDAVSYNVRVWQSTQWTQWTNVSTNFATLSNLPTGYYWYIIEIQAVGTPSTNLSAWSAPVATFNTHRFAVAHATTTALPP